jgi:hypothetical protein
MSDNVHTCSVGHAMSVMFLRQLASICKYDIVFYNDVESMKTSYMEDI